MSAWVQLIADMDIPDGPDDELDYSIESEANDEDTRDVKDTLDRNGVGVYPPPINSTYINAAFDPIKLAEDMGRYLPYEDLGFESSRDLFDCVMDYIDYKTLQQATTEDEVSDLIDTALDEIARNT